MENNSIPFRFDEATHGYFTETGVPVVSVTQVLSSVGLFELDMVPRDVLERKRILGSKVHKASEFLDSPEQGELDWSSVDDDCVPYLVAYERFVKEKEFVPSYIELRGICCINSMTFGYTLDRLGRLGAVNAIIDLKCALDEGVSWPLQLAAYDLAAPPVKGGYAHIAVQLRNDGTYKTFPYSNPYHKDIFLYALAVTTWKINQGMQIVAR